jgi:hypothetical protein
MAAFEVTTEGEDIRNDTFRIGMRKLERETGVSHHTLDKILKSECVRRQTLSKVVKQIQWLGGSAPI